MHSGGGQLVTVWRAGRAVSAGWRHMHSGAGQPGQALAVGRSGDGGGHESGGHEAPQQICQVIAVGIGQVSRALGQPGALAHILLQELAQQRIELRASVHRVPDPV